MVVLLDAEKNETPWRSHELLLLKQIMIVVLCDRGGHGSESSQGGLPNVAANRISSSCLSSVNYSQECFDAPEVERISRLASRPFEGFRVAGFMTRGVWPLDFGEVCIQFLSSVGH